ncbi:HD domain-containing phosphohydrolase [Rhodoferax sp.]|uniref:HD domain-containing phosphohydrolase n=1 Tax=Rhodoferax sp. TaxID=50421 RepID=UPI002616F487|nr:HD domain-containing phosphohydrolase [Rhodoferax sp.]MDD3936218.1 HD domain-containing protein [Rhodoferax sp.]
MWKNKLRLRSQIFLLLTVVFAVNLGMVIYLTNARRHEDIDNAKLHLLHISQTITAKQHQHVDLADRQLLNLTRLFRESKSGPDHECSRRFAQELKVSPEYLNMGVATLSGDIICSALPGFNIADRLYFQEALKTRGLVTSDVIQNRPDHKPTIAFARAIHDESGRVEGVVIASWELGWLAKELTNAKLPPGARLGLFDAEGVVVALHPYPQGGVGKDGSGSPLFKTIRAQGGEGTAELVGLDGVPRIFVFTPFSDTVGGRISLWLSVSREVITAHEDNVFLMTITVVTALLLLAFGMVWIGGNRLLLRPISAISEAARRLSLSDLSARSGLREDNSELGLLARNFDDMAESIQSKEIELIRTNRALRVLSSGNRTLLHATDEETLLHEMCRAIVISGGYRMAWVGYAQDDAEKCVRPVASFAATPEFLQGLGISWASTERGMGPVGVAVRDGIAVATRNAQADPQLEPWWGLARRYNYASVLALPLKVNEAVIGALVIYAEEADAFHESERDLLCEAAGDLAFGIAGHRAKAREAQLTATLQTTRAERDKIAYAHQHHAQILLKALEDSVEAISATVEMRDPYTAGHQNRVAALAVAIGKELALPEDTLRGIHLAADVHDLGKIRVPAEILSKPGKLSAIEMELIKTHAQAGYEILKGIDFPWPIATIVHQHHEMMDGTGYPMGLKGDEILFESRILAVADIIEAMASHRPYRAALGIDVALEEIEENRTVKLDPAVVDACLKLFREKRFAFADANK